MAGKGRSQGDAEGRESARTTGLDEVTGLLGRDLFCSKLSWALRQAKAEGAAVAVLVADIDFFRTVNETFGRAAGDRLLEQVGQRLAAAFPATYTVGRLDGDTFAVVVPNAGEDRTSQVAARRILEAFVRPFRFEGVEAAVSASIGISIHRGDGADPETLLANAETALRAAKRGGRRGYRLFEAAAWRDAVNHAPRTTGETGDTAASAGKPRRSAGPTAAVTTLARQLPRPVSVGAAFAVVAAVAVVGWLLVSALLGGYGLYGVDRIASDPIPTDLRELGVASDKDDEINGFGTASGDEEEAPPKQ